MFDTLLAVRGHRYGVLLFARLSAKYFLFFISFNIFNNPHESISAFVIAVLQMMKLSEDTH